MANCVRESVWERVRFNGQGQRGNREFYRGESTRVRNNNVRNPSAASFMFYNYPENWSVGELWRMFKGVDFLYKRLCSISFSVKQRLMVFRAHQRKFGVNNSSKPKNANDPQKMGTGISNRDARRYIDALRGMSRVVSEPNKKQGSEKEEAESEETTENVRELVITEDDMVGDVIRRGFIGEVKDTKFIEKLPEFCSMEGLFNVEVKYMGGLEVMVILESEEAVKNVVENTDHGVRRWLWKIRRANALSRSLRRLTWLSIVGVPISCWKERVFGRISARWGEVREMSNCNLLGSQGVITGRVLIHTWESNLISEHIVVKIGNSRCIVFIKEEIRDIVQFNILDTEEDEVIVEDTKLEGENWVGGAHDGEGGGDGERVDDQDSRLHFSRKSNEEKGGVENNESDFTSSKGVGNKEEQYMAAAHLDEKVIDKDCNARDRKFKNSGPDVYREVITNLGQKDKCDNKSVGPSFVFHGSKVNCENLKDGPNNHPVTPRILVSGSNTLTQDNCHKNTPDLKGAGIRKIREVMVILMVEDSDSRGKSNSGTRRRRRRRASTNSNEGSNYGKGLSTSGINLNNNKDESCDNNVCSFNNMRKIGEQIGVMWDDVDQPTKKAGDEGVSKP
ncbi:hypothetical protein CTI12_AA562930 [Artemisia annua]|uniref:Uncharacterized protein n=1 Tax=Artemisia annua TaxID=35608 RepID=A0A2U1KUH4_ARTAN|nr:hypothetical protein CTI12_AA562930 [Artemisia annua]